MSAKENEEIDKTVKELNKLSKDPDEVAKYEEREWSIMRYNVEMKTNRELGEKEGETRGLKIGEENEKKKVIKEKDINYLVTDMDALASMFSAQCPAELLESQRREWIEEQVGLYVIKNDWLKDENGESRGILIYGLQPNEWEVYKEN